MLRSWQALETVPCEGEVTYTRLDGTQLALPFVNVFLLRGAATASYRIYIDPAPLSAA